MKKLTLPIQFYLRVSKMKRFFTAAVLLIGILMLASCTNALDEDISTDTSSNTSANQTTTQTESNNLMTSITGEEIVTTKAQTDIQEERYDPINDIYIVGTPLPYEQLLNYEKLEDLSRYCEYEYRYDTWEKDFIVDFLDSLDNNEQKELYFKASSIIRLMANTSTLKISDSLDKNNYDKYIRCNKNGYNSHFFETGYTFDSFFSVLCEVFTEETAEKVIDHYPGFYEYNDELWVIWGAAGSDLSVVRVEYELINQTDTELEFKGIRFHNEADQDYDPDLRDEYTRDYVDFKFVLTENGWRVEKFSNLEDLDKEIIY